MIRIPRSLLALFWFLFLHATVAAQECNANSEVCSPALPPEIAPPFYEITWGVPQLRQAPHDLDLEDIEQVLEDTDMYMTVTRQAFFVLFERDAHYRAFLLCPAHLY